ncbi:GntR family transcriptional regulator [Actinomadura sp. HBU206391]|nr:GntR family transcriptional regulator [Actinomadura sp. HBU206391]
MSESGREFGYLGVLDPDARQAAWQQIANQIRTAIVTGEIKPGEMLPSQPRLASHYGVARETTKAALAWLRNEGLIQTRQGKGTFVRGSTLPGEYQLRTELMVLYERVGRLSGELAAVEGALASLIGRFPVREDESN